MSRNKKPQSGKPYDSSFSFVKRMTRRVSEYIPNKLTSWFASPNEEEIGNEPEPAPTQEQPQQQPSPQSQVPPAKRQRTDLNAPDTWATDPVPSTSAQPGPSAPVSRAVHEAGPSGLSHNPQFQHRGFLPTSTPMHPAKYLVPTSSGLGITVDDASNSSESTSGCSSLVPQENHMAEAPADTSVKTSQKGSQLYSLLFDPNSVNPSNEGSKITPQPPAKSKRPGFDPSLIRSPSICSGSRDVTKSPFYQGKTCYGGASAYRRSMGASPSYLNSSLEMNKSTGSMRNSLSTNSRVPLQRHGSNHSLSWVENNGTASPLLSAVTKQLLKAIETASPSNQTMTSREAGNLKRKIDNLYEYSSPQTQQTGPPIRSLNAPTVRDLMQNKSKVQKVDVARSLTLPKSKPEWKDNLPTYSLRHEESDSTKHCNKIKRKQNDIIDDLPEMVDLPQISLPITGLPTFDFAPKAAAKPAAVSKAVSTVVGNDVQLFTFSAPISVKPTTSPSRSPYSSPRTGPRQDSGSPFKLVNQFTSPKQVDSMFGNTKSLTKSPAAPSLGLPEKLPLPAGSGFGNMFKKAEGSWECSACCVNNKAESSKCVACETPKVKPAKPSAPAPTVIPQAPLASGGFGSLFKKAEGTWECSSCMVSNKAEATKCACCEAQKPGAKPVANKPAAPQTISNPLPIFKSAGSWECSVCMVSNKSDVTKCVACETVKPGSAPAPPVVNSFGDKFKKPADKWSCPVCMVNNDKDMLNCQACNCENPSKPKAKPGESAEKPKFNFGMPKSDATKPSDAPSGFSIPSKPEELKTLFTFGVPKDKEGKEETKKGFVFGDQKTKEDNEKSKGGFSFGVAASAKPAEEMPKASTPGASSPAMPAPASAAAVMQFIVPPASTAPKLKRKAVDADEPVSIFGSSPSKISNSSKEESSFAGFKFSPIAPVKPKSPEPVKVAEPAAKKQPSFNFLEEEESDTPKKTITPSIFAPKPSSTFSAPSSNTPFSFSSKGPDQSTQKKEEAKPSVMFQFGSASKDTQSLTPAFGAPAEKKPAFPSMTDSASKPFSFSTTNSTPAPAFGSKPAEPSAFGQKAPETSIFGAKPAEPPSSIFGSKPAEAPTFGSKPQEIVAFGSKPSEPAIPSFGSDKLAPFKPQESSSSPFGASTTAAPPAFGTQNNLFSASSTSSPAFGAPSSSIFGQASTPATSIFGGAAVTQPNLPAAPPAFGAPAAATPSPFQSSQSTATPGGFGFGNNAGTPAAGSGLFTFGVNKDKPAAVGFGSNPMLAPKPAEIQPFGSQAPTPAFGSGSVAPAFGGGAQSGGFNFSTNAPPAYQATPQQTNAASLGGFNFNANNTVPQFNPEIRPSFNFTANAGPTVFSATPTASAPNPNASLQARKIRKATRRIQPR